MQGKLIVVASSLLLLIMVVPSLVGAPRRSNYQFNSFPHLHLGFYAAEKGRKVNKKIGRRVGDAIQQMEADFKPRDINRAPLFYQENQQEEVKVVGNRQFAIVGLERVGSEQNESITYATGEQLASNLSQSLNLAQKKVKEIQCEPPPQVVGEKWSQTCGNNAYAIYIKLHYRESEADSVGDKVVEGIKNYYRPYRRPKKGGEGANLGNNRKNLSRYANKDTFLVPSNDWQRVLQLVPVTTWTDSQGEIRKYPTLIYYQKKDKVLNRLTRLIRDLQEGQEVCDTLEMGKGELCLKTNYSQKQACQAEPTRSCVELKVLQKDEQSYTVELHNLRNHVKLSRYRFGLTPTLKPGEKREVKIYKYLADQDLTAPINFIRQYNPERVNLVGSARENVIGVLRADSMGQVPANRLRTLETKDLIHYWQSFDQIVYVENNYKQALMASVYASYLNAPLVVENGELDKKEIRNKRDVICVGDVRDTINCQQAYTSSQLRQKYAQLTGTNKLIVTNPQDLYQPREKGTFNSFSSYYTADKISQIGTGISLASAYLGAARQEIILPVDSRSPDQIDTKVAQAIGKLGISERGPKIFYQGTKTKGNVIVSDLGSGERAELLSQGVKGEDSIKEVAITDNLVAWWQQGTIYLYNLTSGNKTEVAQGVDNRLQLALSPQILAWKEKYSAKIRYYHITSGQQRVADNDCRDCGFLDVSSHKLAYVKKKAVDDLIVVLDTKTGEKETIKFPYLPQGVQLTSDYLIWKKHPNKIYYYDLASGEKDSMRLKDYVGHIRALGKTIMWMMSSSSKVGVYRYKTSKKYVERLTTFSGLISDVKDVSANERYFAWDINKGRYFAWDINKGPKQQDIFIYDAETDEVKQLGQQALQRSPDLDGNKIVWIRNTRARSKLSGFLTVVGNPHRIPIRRKSQKAISDEDPLMESLDASAYADTNGDATPDLGTGRIMGLTMSDASVLVARNLFYHQLQAVPDEMLYAYSPTNLDSSDLIKEEMSQLRSRLTPVRESSYNLQRAFSQEEGHEFSPSLWRNKGTIIYEDHGNPSWAGIPSFDIPQLKNTVHLVFACNTCADYGPQSFCLQSIRQGSPLYLGTLSGAYDSKLPLELFSKLYHSNLAAGFAYASSYRPQEAGYLEYQLLGDPVLKIDPDYPLSDPLLTSGTKKIIKREK